MKKGTKILIALLVVAGLVVTGCLVACLSGIVVMIGTRYLQFYYIEYRPSAQENTVWCSENGDIVIYIDENGWGKAIFDTNGSKTETYFVSEVGYYASVYDLEVLETKRQTQEAHYERWRYTKIKPNSFSIEVEKTTFLEVGEEITFYKMQDEE